MNPDGRRRSLATLAAPPFLLLQPGDPREAIASIQSAAVGCALATVPPPLEPDGGLLF